MKIDWYILFQDMTWLIFIISVISMFIFIVIGWWLSVLGATFIAGTMVALSNAAHRKGDK